MLSTRTPQMTPVMRERAGLSLGAWAKKSSNLVCFLICAFSAA
jgi:hypothetical protein